MKIKIKDKEINIEKKYLIVLGSVVLLLILLNIWSIFFKPTILICTLEKSSISANTVEKVNFEFKNNSLKNMYVYYKNTPTSDYLYMLEAIYNNYNNQLETLKNNGGYDYTIELGNDYVLTEANIDVSKIPQSTVNDIGFSNEWTYDRTKQDMEDNGFECK